MENILYVKEIIDFRIPKSLRNPLSFEVNKNDGVMLLGENGSGKTSLLRIVANILKPNKGNILLKTEQISFLPYKNALYPFLKIKHYINNFEHPFIIHLKKNSNEYIGNLSAGQQRLISIFLSMQKKKDFWILDEPTVFLDKDWKKKFYLYLYDYINTGGAVLMSTHDENLDFLKKICL